MKLTKTNIQSEKSGKWYKAVKVELTDEEYRDLFFDYNGDEVMGAMPDKVFYVMDGYNDDCEDFEDRSDIWYLDAGGVVEMFHDGTLTEEQVSSIIYLDIEENL